ncbi:MAG: hypothetical protein FOGNACKC_02316 [Anaerolineae bacterium]|nr:hypothetical protein [Anaerolineae bacterium]
MTDLSYSPFDFSSELAPGQKLKAGDLDFYALLRRQSSEGKLYFNQQRAVLFDVAAIGTLRKQLLSIMGPEAVTGVLLRFGYTHGYQDAEILYQNHSWASDEDWLAAGPALHSLAGVVKVETQQLEFNRDTGVFYMQGVWHHSFEAEEHLRLFGPSDRPVCATLAGYASGYASRFFGQNLLAIETTCVGMGHSHCTWEIKPVAEWGPKGQEYLHLLERSSGALNEQLSMISSFVQTSRVVLFRWQAAPGWPVEYVSDNVVQFNLDPKKLRAAGFLYKSIIHPLDHELVEQAAWTNMENRVDHFSYDYRIIDDAGQIRWLSTHVSAQRNPQGQVTHYIGLNLDITHRKEIEERLHRLSIAVEQSANTVVITDTNGYIEYANPRFEETTGYTLQEAIGQHTRLLKSGETSSEEYKRMWQNISAGQEWRGEFHNKKKNGELYWEKALISPIKNERGEITHFLAVKEEITAQRQAELALARRITEMEIVSKVGAAASTLLDVSELLDTVVNLTRDSFDLYHVNVFLVDEPGNTLVLAAGSGDVGRQMVESGLQIPYLDDKSLIAQVARSQQGRIIYHTKAQPDYQPDPLLPLTASEMVIPIAAGNTLFGVLNVQSEAEAHFVSDDLQVYTTLTNQIAVAIRNARLYENATQAQHEAEARLRETQILQQLTQALAGVQHAREVIDTFLSSCTRLLGFDFVIFSLVDDTEQRVKAVAGVNVSDDHLKRANHPLSSSDIMADIIRSGKTEIISGWDPRFDVTIFESEHMANWGMRVFMPIALRGNNVGLIEVGFKDNPGEKQQEYQLRLLQSLVNQTAVALESARRYDAIENAARREQLLRQASAKIRSSADVNSVLRVAAQEVGRALGRPAFVQLSQKDNGHKKDE